MIICHKHRIVFLHVCKTGGTSIAQAMSRCGEEHGERHGLDVPEFAKDFLTLCVVRNPIDRLVSAYCQRDASRFGGANCQLPARFFFRALQINPRAWEFQPQANYARRCDLVIPFEKLAIDTARAIPCCAGPLPHLNPRARSAPPLRDLVTPEVLNYYAEDITCFESGKWPTR